MAFSHLLELENVHTELSLAEGTLRAVDGVSLTIDAGETLGIVGESGSGKSMTALSIMRLLPRSGRIVEGSIRFKDRVLSDLSEDEMEAIRGTEMAMIFQDPMTSLNPVYRTGWQVGEPLRIHRHVGSGEAIATATDLFRQVGIPDARSRVRHFPHMLSGGMRQRAMIAMGLSMSPSLLIADEPTTALDVTIQAQILDLLRRLNREYGTATILITHNLGVVAGMCDRVIVMYAGRIVEQGRTDDVFSHPEHPYTPPRCGTARAAHADRRLAARHGPSAGRLQVPAAMPVRGGALQPRGAISAPGPRPARAVLGDAGRHRAQWLNL